MRECELAHGVIRRSTPHTYLCANRVECCHYLHSGDLSYRSSLMLKENKMKRHSNLWSAALMNINFTRENEVENGIV